MRRVVPLIPILALSCRSEHGLVAADLELVLDSPTYGAFLGEGPIQVLGRVSPASAVVKVEGERVPVSPDGKFVANVPFARRYHIVDVEAAWGDDLQRVRVPVFDGHDPMDTWPGGVTMRLTPAGLAHMGEGLGAVVDATGWDTMLAGALPVIDTDMFDLVPTGVTHDPTVVELLPAEGGVDTAISLRQVMVGYDVTFTVWGLAWTAPMQIGFGEIALGALAVPAVDDDGMLSIGLTQSTIRLDDPDITIDGIDGWLLELLVEGVMDWIVEPLGELLLDLVLGSFGTIPLGGPYAFETDLMGMSLDMRLSEVYGDLDGLGAGLGVGIDAPAIVGPLGIPAPPGYLESAPVVHAALGLHEGLLQSALSTGILDMLTQEIQLGGMFGEVIGGGIRALPGGHTAPAGDGWCLAIQPNPAQVVRLAEGTNPLAVLYLPDMGVNVGIVQGGSCTTWLEASVAAEIGLDVKDGTKIGVDVGFVEGAVLEYGATSDWEEQEVVDGLLGFLGGAMSLLGGMVEFDLADMMGGFGGSGSDDPLSAALGDLQPQIVGSHALIGDDGAPIEGMYAVELQLWEE